MNHSPWCARMQHPNNAYPSDRGDAPHLPWIAAHTTRLSCTSPCGRRQGYGRMRVIANKNISHCRLAGSKHCRVRVSLKQGGEVTPPTNKGAFQFPEVLKGRGKRVEGTPPISLKLESPLTHHPTPFSQSTGTAGRGDSQDFSRHCVSTAASLHAVAGHVVLKCTRIRAGMSNWREQGTPHHLLLITWCHSISTRTRAGF